MLRTEIWKLIVKFCQKNTCTITWYVLFSALAHAVETLVVPKILAKLFTEMSDLVLVRWNIFCFLVAFAIEKIFYLASNYMSRKIEPSLTSFLSVEFIYAIFRKYEQTHCPIDTVVVMEKIIVMREAIEDLIYYVYKLIPILIVMIVTICTIFMMNVKLGYFVLGSVVALISILYMLPRPKKETNRSDVLNRYIEDVFSNIDFIASTEGGVEKACKEIEEKIASLKRQKDMVNLRISTNQTIGYFISTVLYSGCIIYLYSLFKRGEVSIKDFEAYILILGQLFRLTYDISYQLPDFMRGLQIIENLGGFIEELFSHKCKEGKDIDLEEPDIVFEGVSFNYGNKILLENFSCVLGYKEMVCLYGESGSGKTSFTKLILDILQPVEGKILLEGHNIKDINKKSLHHYISNVAQNTTSLIQVTIYENIIFGLEDSQDLRKNIEEIVKEYSLDKIFNDPKFLDTVVGKGGTTLSGGQKQIVHLLHAVVNEKSKIVILDEPTSALDEVSKGNVIRLIKDLNKTKTVLIITHDACLKEICSTVLEFTAGENPTLISQDSLEN